MKRGSRIPGQTSTEYMLVLSAIVIAAAAAAYVFLPDFSGGVAALATDVSSILATGDVGGIGFSRNATGVAAAPAAAMRGGSAAAAAAAGGGLGTPSSAQAATASGGGSAKADSAVPIAGQAVMKGGGGNQSGANEASPSLPKDSADPLIRSKSDQSRQQTIHDGTGSPGEHVIDPEAINT